MAEKKSIAPKTDKVAKPRKVIKKVEDAEVVNVEVNAEKTKSKKFDSKKAENISRFVVANINGNQEYLYEGMKLEVLRIEGDTYETKEVMMSVDGDKVIFGKPFISGASVELKKIDDYRGKKVRTMTYKAKSRYRKIRGSRPSLSMFEVAKITF